VYTGVEAIHRQLETRIQAQAAGGKASGAVDYPIPALFNRVGTKAARRPARAQPAHTTSERGGARSDRTESWPPHRGASGSGVGRSAQGASGREMI
jgi:hypothetical protein